MNNRTIPYYSRVISKKELCKVFGLFRGLRPRYRELRTDYFSDDALEKLGITQQRYKFARKFTASESKKIIDFFGIEPDELLD